MWGSSKLKKLQKGKGRQVRFRDYYTEMVYLSNCDPRGDQTRNCPPVIRIQPKVSQTGKHRTPRNAYPRSRKGSEAPPGGKWHCWCPAVNSVTDMLTEEGPFSSSLSPFTPPDKWVGSRKCPHHSFCVSSNLYMKVYSCVLGTGAGIL